MGLLKLESGFSALSKGVWSTASLRSVVNLESKR